MPSPTSVMIPISTAIGLYQVGYTVNLGSLETDPWTLQAIANGSISFVVLWCGLLIFDDWRSRTGKD